VSGQGQVRFQERWTGTAGLRYDYRDDLQAGRVTPRIALVFRPRDHHVLKAQYAEAFRAPTFFEQFGLSRPPGNSGLDYETMGTAEASYIFRNPTGTVRATAFDARIRNMIFPFGGGAPPAPPPVFRNIGRARSHGVEVEAEHRLHPGLKLGGNLSWVKAQDSRRATNTDSTSSGSAEWMGDLRLATTPARHLLVGAHLYYVGERFTGAGPVDGYARVDLTLTLRDVVVRGLTLRGSVRNLFDDTIRYLRTLPTGVVQEVYGPRSVWLQASYRM
jgi:iron complex outermembrane receptor protein